MIHGMGEQAKRDIAPTRKPSAIYFSPTIHYLPTRRHTWTKPTHTSTHIFLSAGRLHTSEDLLANEDADEAAGDRGQGQGG